LKEKLYSKHQLLYYKQSSSYLQNFAIGAVPICTMHCTSSQLYRSTDMPSHHTVITMQSSNYQSVAVSLHINSQMTHFTRNRPLSQSHNELQIQ